MKLVILDVGGVLRDSSLAMGEGFRKGFKAYKLPYNFSPDDIWHMRGVGKYNERANCIKALLAIFRKQADLGEILKREDAEKILDILVSQSVTKDDNELVDKIGKIYRKYFVSEETRRLITILPNSIHAVELLSKYYQLAIFTNSSTETVKRDIKDFDLSRFSVILGEEQVKNKKPSGEGLKKICKMLAVAPAETVYIGDAVVDIMAARNAGCKCAVVLSGMGLEQHLRKERPDYIFENLYEAAKYLTKSV